MPRLPHESLPCETCRKVKDAVLSASKKMKKHILIYSLFYILGMEISSVFLAEQENYLTYWYPLLNTFGYFILILTLFLFGERLRFCTRKYICVISLLFYYFFPIVCLIFQISDEFYTSIINYTLLSVFGISLFLTLFNNKK